MPRRKKRPSPFDDLGRLIERDLTALAKKGCLERAYGLDDRVAEVAALVVRGPKHPMLVGEPGVGKSALVQELARAVVEGRADPALEGARVVEVSLDAVAARAANKREAGELFEALVADLEAGPVPVVVHLRDLVLVQDESVGPVLAHALAASSLRFVLETPPALADWIGRNDPGLAELLHVLVVEEPSLETVRGLLGRVAEAISTPDLEVDLEACDMALRQSTRFLLAKRHPRKAIDLLRETAASAIAAGKATVEAEDVLARFCEATRLPRFVVDDAVPLDLAEAERHFTDRILGQPDAVATVLRSVALLKAGLNDPRRPLGVFLFAGPTGVGKTALAKLLAEYLFGNADRLVRVNMADYRDEQDDLVLFGSPWAPSLEGRRGDLARLIEGRVFAVLLLDEFEKAHRDCHDRFLQLFDEGRFVNAAGQSIPCNNTIIVCSSNAGAEVYREPPIGFAGDRVGDELTAEVERRIREAFRAEFLNRFDAVCHFVPLGRVDIRRIALREVGEVLGRDGIRARALDVEVAPEVIDRLVARGYSPLFGARFLQREIEKTLTAALAVEIVKEPLRRGARVEVRLEKGDRVRAVVFKEAAEPRQTLSLPAEGASVARRTLDGAALVAEAMELAARAEALQSAAGRRALRARHRELLAVVQGPTFWDDAEAAAETLREFRAVESRLTELSGLLSTCQHALRRARAVRGDRYLAAAARAVEAAAAALRMAEAQVASGALGRHDEVLVEVSATSHGAAAAAWALEVARMLQRWGEKRRYAVEAVAEAEEPKKAVLRFEGPGVRAFLAAEAGSHVRVEAGKRTVAAVRLHASPPDETLPTGLEVSARRLKRQKGTLVVAVTARAEARDPSTGRVVELAGSGSEDDLARLAAALLVRQADPLEEARRYHVGRGPHVDDPRTGETTPRIKDVLRGELDQFIAAWISRSLSA